MSKIHKKKFCCKMRSNKAYTLGFNSVSSRRPCRYDYTREEWDTILCNFNSYRSGRKHGFKKRTHEIYKKLCQKLCVYLISAITAIVFGIMMTSQL